VLVYSDSELKLAQKTVARLNEFAARLMFSSPHQPSPDLDQLLYDVRVRMQEAMDNDLNLPRAMGYLFAFMKDINRLINQGLMDDQQTGKVLQFMRDVDKVLGVMDFDQSPEQSEPEIDALIAERSQARREGDYARADALREKLADMGVRVIDTPDGARWRRL
jgi:cysteinyl-tRNA synthetase